MRFVTAPPAPSALPSEDSDELSDAELGELFDPELPADDGDPFDTEEASDLDVGVLMEDLDASSDDDLPAVDFGSDEEDLLPFDDSEDSGSATEEPDFDVADSLPELAELSRDDDAEGPDDELGDLAQAALPALDRGEDSEGALERDEVPATWSAGDEPRPAPAAKAWTELATSLSLEACSALAIADGVVVAASTDLFWFVPGSLTPLRLEAGSSRIRSLALTTTNWEYAVCATSNGRLLRRGRLAAASEELRGARELVPASSAPELFELCQPGAGFPHALLVSTGRGVLMRSDDDGLTFRRVTDRRVRALSPRGAPALALSHDARLLTSEDGGGTFQEVELPDDVLPLARGDAPLVAGHGAIVVVAEPQLGLAVSLDRGRSFTRVAGTVGVSAVCASDFEGQPCAWAALYDEADRSHIVRIDPATGRAERIALFDFSGSHEDDESAELARVARMEWDPQHGRLWLAGGFGVKVLSPA